MTARVIQTERRFVTPQGCEVRHVRRATIITEGVHRLDETIELWTERAEFDYKARAARARGQQ